MDTHPKPDHVPAGLVRDFDFTDFPGVIDDPQLAWRRVQETYPDIFWTPRNGGHWVVTRAEPMREIFETYSQFSNLEPFLPRTSAPRLVPVQMDPPEHTAYRKILMPGFLPRNVAAVELKARDLAHRIVEDLVPRGECEFVRDFAEAMAISVFLGMMGLPLEDLSILRENLKYTQEVDRAGGFERFNRYLASWIEKRTAEPGDDLISAVIKADVDGRPLTPFEIRSMCLLLLTGGLDTVVTMMSAIALYLAAHPEPRRRLADAPEISVNAVEELIRRHGVTNMGRVVVHDVEFRGLRFKAGEQVLLPTMAAGLDEQLNADALAVDFEREAPRHLAFGAGPHTCIGAALARRELRIFLEVWLKRIPDFDLKPGARPKIHAGIVNTIDELWLTWDPVGPS